MFQFTREFIINNNEGKLEGGVKFLTKNGTMFIDNLINLRAKDINAVYRNPFAAEVNEKLEVTLPAAAAANKDKVYRLVITLGQEGRVISTFNDQYPDHSRHFFYEATADASGKFAAGLQKAFDREATLSDVKFMKLTATDAKLTIEAPDCYTRIKEVRLVTLPVADITAKIGAVLTGYDDYDVEFDIVRADFGTATEVSSFRAGDLGNGNTTQILHNMRLQTAANIDPYGTQADERPVPKGHYDQYLVELVTERRHIGHDVVGSIGTSLTSHVFYVLADNACNDDSVSAKFKAELEKLGVEVEDAKKHAGPKRALAHTSDLPEEPADESSSN